VKEQGWMKEKKTSQLKFFYAVKCKMGYHFVSEVSGFQSPKSLDLSAVKAPSQVRISAYDNNNNNNNNDNDNSEKVTISSKVN
jgi:hypothetical protein